MNSSETARYSMNILFLVMIKYDDLHVSLLGSYVSVVFWLLLIKLIIASVG